MDSEKLLYFSEFEFIKTLNIFHNIIECKVFVKKEENLINVGKTKLPPILKKNTLIKKLKIFKFFFLYITCNNIKHKNSIIDIISSIQREISFLHIAGQNFHGINIWLFCDFMILKQAI